VKNPSPKVPSPRHRRHDARPPDNPPTRRIPQNPARSTVAPGELFKSGRNSAAGG